jgi:hypothetical protein
MNFDRRLRCWALNLLSGLSILNLNKPVQSNLKLLINEAAINPQLRNATMLFNVNIMQVSELLQNSLQRRQTKKSMMR